MSNSPEDHEQISEDKQPERPLECSDCRKMISTLYTEIVGRTIVNTCMCSDCPVLQRRLFGLPPSLEGGHADGQAELACGNCGTTLEALRVGEFLGCSVCYEVFDDMLLSELRALGKIPPRLATTKKSQTIHIGRASGEPLKMSSSMRLLALSEALNETLKREDYERAAWLRDQIKALTESLSEEKNNGE